MDKSILRFTMSKFNSSDGKESYLRKYIERLKSWTENNPPTREEIEALQQELLLTRNEYETVSRLAQSHIERGRIALADGDYDQAVAEFSRAAQLKPRDPNSRVELAEIYLQWKKNRRYAIRLIETALVLQPDNPAVRRFLNKHRWLKIRMHQSRHHLSRLTLVVLILFLAGGLWWNWNWVIRFFGGSIPVVAGNAHVAGRRIGQPRPIEVDTERLKENSLEAEITLSEVGSRNESSYFHLLGRLSSSTHDLDTLKLLIRGRREDNTAQFAIPLTVLGEHDSPLRKGDTQPLFAYHWLAESDVDIQRIDVDILELQRTTDNVLEERVDVEVYWRTPRLEGMGIAVDVRNSRFIEAYDRQVLLMDLAVENSGVSTLGSLTFELILNSQEHPYSFSPVDNATPPMVRGERRIFPVLMGLPLKFQTFDYSLKVNITGAQIRS